MDKKQQVARLALGFILVAFLLVVTVFPVVVKAQEKPSYGPPTWPYKVYPNSYSFGSYSSYDFLNKHTGVDVLAPAGTAVYATCSGDVVWWGDWPWEGDGSWQNTIWIDCRDGNYFGFTHLDDQAVHVVVGDKVLVGQQIAVTMPLSRLRVGDDAHLHLQKKTSNPVNVNSSNLSWDFEDPTVGIDFSRSPAERLAEAMSFSGSLGTSAGGLDIPIRRWGSGPIKKLIVCAIHGGYEQNTFELCKQLEAKIDSNPSVIPNGVTLYLVPSLNPDGQAKGTRVLDARTNGNGVDLNRNWPYDWQSQVDFKGTTMSAGSAPLDQPETKALQEFIIAQQPESVIFYHSSWGVIFTNPQGKGLQKTMMTATGYGPHEGLTDMHGDAIDYLGTIGVPGIEIELTSWDQTEFDQNWKGFQAYMSWRLNPVAEATPLPVNVKVFSSRARGFGEYGDKYQINEIRLLNAISPDGRVLISKDELVNCNKMFGELNLYVENNPEKGYYSLENFNGTKIVAAGACDVCSWIFYTLRTSGFSEPADHPHVVHPKIPDVPAEYSVSINRNTGDHGDWKDLPREQNAWAKNDNGQDMVLRWTVNDDDTVSMWVEPSRGQSLSEAMLLAVAPQPAMAPDTSVSEVTPTGEVVVLDLGKVVNGLFGISNDPTVQVIEPMDEPTEVPTQVATETPVPSESTSTATPADDAPHMDLPCDTSRLAPMFFRIPVGRWACELIAESDAVGIDPNLAASHMRTESCGGTDFESTSVGWGLMQVLPSTFPDYTLEQLSNKDINIRLGVGYIAGGLKASGGNVSAEAAGYNGGPMARSWFEASTDPNSEIYKAKKAAYAAKMASIGIRANKAKIVETYVAMITSLYSDGAAGKYYSTYVDSAVKGGGMCKTAATQLGLPWPIPDGYFVGNGQAVRVVPAPQAPQASVASSSASVETPSKKVLFSWPKFKVVIPVVSLAVFSNWLIAVCFLFASILMLILNFRSFGEVIFSKNRKLAWNRAKNDFIGRSLVWVIPLLVVTNGIFPWQLTQHPTPPSSALPQVVQETHFAIENEAEWRKWVEQTPGISWSELIASVKASQVMYNPQVVGEVTEQGGVKAQLNNILALWPSGYNPEMGEYDPSVPGELGYILETEDPSLWQFMVGIKELYPTAIYDANGNGLKDEGDKLFVHTQTGGLLGLCSADPKLILKLGWTNFDPWNNPDDCARYFAVLVANESGPINIRARELSVTMPSQSPNLGGSSVVVNHQLKSMTVSTTAVTTPLDTLILWSENYRIKLDDHLSVDASRTWYKANYNACTFSWALAARDCWKEVGLR